MDHGHTPGSNKTSDLPEVSLEKIESLLRTKDDTQRFVGLALLKSVLDTSQQIREDEAAVSSLWSSISGTFLDRLLRSKDRNQKENAHEMVTLAVSILYTFAILLPEQSRKETRLTKRIPGLVAALLVSSSENTTVILKTITTLVSSPEGAAALWRVDDLTPLTEAAPTHSGALDVLRYAILHSEQGLRPDLLNRLLQSLSASFTGTDAVTLLEFVDVLDQVPLATQLSRPKWLQSIATFIRALAISRPNPKARAAYTTAAGTLVRIFADDFIPLLFRQDSSSEKPFSYLMINLLLIDIRSSIPTLQHELNSPKYTQTSRRLADACVVITAFVGFLIKSIEDDTPDQPLVMVPDNLLKLRKEISETLSVTMEYLRDRWDASKAGTMGLHPDAIPGKSETWTGSHYTLTWDSMKHGADQDPFVFCSLQLLGVWVREDDNTALHKEALGLMDMFMYLYRSSTTGGVDFRPPILLMFSVLVGDDGRRDFLQQGGWKTLSRDLVSILPTSSIALEVPIATIGVQILDVLVMVISSEEGAIPDEWMDLITSVAAWDYPDHRPGLSRTEIDLQVTVLSLCSMLLTKASPGVQRRYIHSAGSIKGIAHRAAGILDDPFAAELNDVITSLESLH